MHALGRPILVGTASIKDSEELAADLESAGIHCAVLNAKNDELEAGIVAQAGMPGAVTISTNMAGRGVDIRLGGAEESHRGTVAAAGGLCLDGSNITPDPTAALRYPGATQRAHSYILLQSYPLSDTLTDSGLYHEAQ